MRVAIASAAWSVAAPMPTPRCEMASTTVGDEIYVIGGFTTPDGSEGTAFPAYPATGANYPTAVVEIFNVTSNTWRKGPDYPFPVDHASAVTYHGTVYVFGGYVSTTFRGTALSYKLEAGATRWTQVASLPQARGAGVAGVMGDHALVAAGQTGAGTGEADFLHEVDLYDFAKDSWSPLAASLPSARDHASGTVIGDRFVVMGGQGYGSQITNATEIYDATTGKWTTGAPVPTPRRGSASMVWEDGILLAGGVNRTAATARVDWYDPSTDSWTRLADLQHPKYSMGRGSIDGVAYVIGGTTWVGSGVDDAFHAVETLRTS